MSEKGGFPFAECDVCHEGFEESFFCKSCGANRADEHFTEMQNRYDDGDDEPGPTWHPFYICKNCCDHAAP